MSLLTYIDTKNKKKIEFVNGSQGFIKKGTVLELYVPG